MWGNGSRFAASTSGCNSIIPYTIRQGVMRALFAVTRTGGHVVPALGVAETLRERVPQFRICFVGTKQGVEARLVPLAGFELNTIPVAGLSRRVNLGLLLFPWMVLRALQCAITLLIRYKPRFVFCTGGYASGPVGLAAWLLNLPLIVHEQNNFPGLSVRLLSRISSVVFIFRHGQSSGRS